MSDDNTAIRDGGHLDWFAAGRMDPDFSKAAFAMVNVGDISQPVLSSYGYHIIRFEGRRPGRQLSFDEVEERRSSARYAQRYVNEHRDLQMDAIRNDPKMKINQAAVDSLYKPLDPGVYRPQSAAVAAVAAEAAAEAKHARRSSRNPSSNSMSDGRLPESRHTGPPSNAAAPDAATRIGGRLAQPGHSAPAPLISLRDRALFANFFRRELTSRYLGSVTGLAWAFLHPLALLASITSCSRRCFAPASSAA